MAIHVRPDVNVDVNADVRLESAQGLINKYFLPKVALTLISVAALAGTYLTMRTHGATFAEAVMRWLHFSALATLTGGTMWWGFLTASESKPLRRFHGGQARRFARIGLGAVVVLVATTPVMFRFADWAVGHGVQSLFRANIAVLAVAVIATADLLRRTMASTDVPRASWDTTGRSDAIPTADPSDGATNLDQHQRTRRHIRLVFSLLALSVAVTATLDAQLTFGSGTVGAPLLRAIHLLAYCLWLGGAVWNIFVAGPAAKQALSFDVVYAAALQLERFRWVVRFALPTLLVTGIIQVVAYTGLYALSWRLLTTTPFGQIVLLKLGLIAALVGVFITCPLWRACSPIKGICELNDMGEGTSGNVNAPRAAATVATRRLDNRGKGCAGFVTIQKNSNPCRRPLSSNC